MKWAITIQRRIRVALMLALLMFCLVVLSLIESYNINRSSESFNSIFQDRLVPAVDLYTISDHLDEEQSRMTRFLHSEAPDKSDMLNFLRQNNSQLQLLVGKYEKTYLVKDEKNYLRSFKLRMEKNHQDNLYVVENANTSDKEAVRRYFLESSRRHDHLRNDVKKLVQIQTEVGNNLLSEYRKSQANSLFVTNMQLFIAVVLGVLIVILVITDKQVLIKQDNYRMN